MFKPLALFIGLRYTRAKRRDHFISFISFISILGIGLGVAALITVLSVMNGFDQEIKTQILSMAAPISIKSEVQPWQDWRTFLKKIKNNPAVVTASPVVYGQGMLLSQGMAEFAVLQGILPDHQVTRLPDKMTQGRLQALSQKRFQIILGEGLANQLGVTVGDTVTLVVPNVNVSIVGVMPRLKTFHVAGVFQAGFQYDSHLAFIRLQDAQILFRQQGSISSVDVKVHDLYQAPLWAKKLGAELGPGYQVTDWTFHNRGFFQALKLEKTLMFIMLLLIVTVAAFNILATLVMVVTDKQSEIAILRTLGASPQTVMRIFMVQGTLIGLLGIFIGIVGGVILALNVTDWVASIEQYFQIKILSPQVYFISNVPSVLELSDVFTVSLVAFLMCVVATIYPALKAARTLPAEALRYE